MLHRLSSQHRNSMSRNSILRDKVDFEGKGMLVTHELGSSQPMDNAMGQAPSQPMPGQSVRKNTMD